MLIDDKFVMFNGTVLFVARGADFRWYDNVQPSDVEGILAKLPAPEPAPEPVSTAKPYIAGLGVVR